MLSPTTRANDLGPKRDAPTLRESALLVGTEQITSPLLQGFSSPVGALFTY